jgi:signal transduction histidine kinase
MRSVSAAASVPAPLLPRQKYRARVIPVAAAATCCTIVFTIIIATWDDAPVPRWIWPPLVCGGLSFGITGAVLWRRQPDNRTGPVMCVVGLTWYIGALQLADDPILFGIGFSFCYLTAAAMSHLVLIQPSGRLETWYERALIVTQYVAVPLTDFPRFVAEYPPPPQGWGTQVLPSLSGWTTTSNVVLFVFTGLNIVLVLRRWARVGRRTRRKYAPVVAAVLFIGTVGLLDSIAALLIAPPAIRQVFLMCTAVAYIITPVTIAVGLLRTRMIQLRLADLVVRLDESAEPGHVRSAIAYALDDPSVDICFPLPNNGGYTHIDGRPMVSTELQGRGATVVGRRGKPLAILLHDQTTGEYRPLVEAVTATARLALENARMLAIERAQLDEVRESRARIVRAADQERKRIQRDLHDGVQHGLLAIAMRVEQARTAHQSGASAAATAVQSQQLTAAAEELRNVIRELRLLVEGIHPPALAEQGLAAAVEVLAERAPLPVRAVIDHRRWPEVVERAAYFVIAEAIVNAYKHSGATTVIVRVGGTPGRLVVTVSDDGSGGAEMSMGTGLRGLDDRVGALGGTLRIESSSRYGTSVAAEIPCEP